MKSFTNLVLALLFLLAIPTVSQAQNTISLPNSSFENWSNGNGYNVNLVVMSLSFYDDYTYPTNWDFLAYPVSIPILTTSINADLPLLKITHETNLVADGSSALKMESFKLSDIIGSTIYSMIESSLDTGLANMVIPTILSTGKVQVDQLMSLMMSLSENTGDMEDLLSMLQNEDVNNYIEGGIALNGHIPGRLTGKYHYASATEGDNGGIMMVGTKYNTSTHRREVVGGGFSMDLSDNTGYSPFEVEYLSLNELSPANPAFAADSLIIFIFSSASENIQQGSALWVDDLTLWEYEGDPDNVSSVSSNNMRCFPNPANGQCQLQFQQKPLSIKLYSIDGKLLQQTTPLTENITLELPYKGVFILHCETDQGIITRKIVNQ